MVDQSRGFNLSLVNNKTLELLFLRRKYLSKQEYSNQEWAKGFLNDTLIYDEVHYRPVSFINDTIIVNCNFSNPLEISPYFNRYKDQMLVNVK
jgi:hypothetical protein